MMDLSDEDACTVEQGNERCLLPFYIRFDIPGIDFIPVFHNIIGSDKVLAREVFPLVGTLGPRGTSPLMKMQLPTNVALSLIPVTVVTLLCLST